MATLTEGAEGTSLAMGNIIGSNVANLTLVLAIPVLVVGGNRLPGRRQDCNDDDVVVAATLVYSFRSGLDDYSAGRHLDDERTGHLRPIFGLDECHATPLGPP